MFHWFDCSFTRTVDLHINSFEHSRQITGDLGIPKSNDTISFLLKPKLPFTIAGSILVFIVMSAVDFDDEAGGRTEKVHNVGADRRLTSEVRPVYRKLFKRAP